MPKVHLGLEVLVHRVPWNRGLSVLLVERQGTAGAKACDVVPRANPAKEGEIEEPSMLLSDDRAQQLMDNLWDCGFRPSEGSGSAGALLATQNDMQRLVFDVLGPRAVPR